jgi:hypothetical protein
LDQADADDPTETAPECDEVCALRVRILELVEDQATLMAQIAELQDRIAFLEEEPTSPTGAAEA